MQFDSKYYIFPNRNPFPGIMYWYFLQQIIGAEGKNNILSFVLRITMHCIAACAVLMEGVGH